MVWRFNRDYDRTHGPRRRNNLWPGTYYVGQRRSNALHSTPGSASQTYAGLWNLGQRRIIYRGMRRAGLQGIRRAAGNIRMARLVRRQALDRLFGGRHEDARNIVESFIPSNQITQRANAEIAETHTVNAEPARRAAIVTAAAFPANHHSGHPVSNNRRGVGVNTNTLREVSRLFQQQTGGNVFYNKLN